jgi:hypothetical protein
MDISITMNDIIQSTIILIIIIYGTKLTNYYYNFYHIYNYLDYEQKLGYFKYNYLVNLISKYVFIKKIIVYYFLIPIIKLNYLFISIFITLFYSLCYNEFKKIISEQPKKKYKNKKNLEIILSETSNDINNSSNLNNINTTNDIIQINNDNSINDIDIQNDIDTQNDVEQKNSNFDTDIKIFKNEIYDVDKIGIDYDNGILNIIEFISDTNLKNTYIQTDKNNILQSESESESKEQELDNKNEIFINNQINNNDFKLNLLDEIDLLKINKETHNKYNDTNDINNTNVIDDDDLDNYINNNNIVSVIKNNNMNYNINNDYNIDYNNDYNIDNDINKYLIVDKEIKNVNSSISQNEELNETINLDEIDFGMKIENLNINSVKNNSVVKIENNTKKKIIKIGKKK